MREAYVRHIGLPSSSCQQGTPVSYHTWGLRAHLVAAGTAVAVIIGSVDAPAVAHNLARTAPVAYALASLAVGPGRTLPVSAAEVHNRPC